MESTGIAVPGAAKGVPKLRGKAAVVSVGKATRDERMPEMPGRLTDRLHFSVTAPQACAPGSRFLLDVWAHLEGQRSAVLRRARESNPSGEVVMRGKARCPSRGALCFGSAYMRWRTSRSRRPRTRSTGTARSAMPPFLRGRRRSPTRATAGDHHVLRCEPRDREVVLHHRSRADGGHHRRCLEGGATLSHCLRVLRESGQEGGASSRSRASKGRQWTGRVSRFSLAPIRSEMGRRASKGDSHPRRLLSVLVGGGPPVRVGRGGVALCVGDARPRFHRSSAAGSSA